MKLLILALLLSTNLIASIDSEITNCDFKIPSYILLNNSSETNFELKNMISNFSNCSPTINKEIEETIYSINGNIPISYLKNSFSEKKINLISTRKNIIISNFTNYLINLLNTKNKTKNIINVKSDLNKELIFSFDELNISFDPEKNIAIITGPDRSSPEKFSFDFQKNIDVYISKKDLYPYSSELILENTIFLETKPVWNSEISNIINKDTNLKNFHLVKILYRNTPLKSDDISLKTVIQTGKLVTVILKKSGLLIKTIGVSQNAGKIGDAIEVKLNSNKIIKGTIKFKDEYYVQI